VGPNTVRAHQEAYTSSRVSVGDGADQTSATRAAVSFVREVSTPHTPSCCPSNSAAGSAVVVNFSILTVFVVSLLTFLRSVRVYGHGLDRFHFSSRCIHSDALDERTTPRSLADHFKQ
jgi:hypothetical protein